MSDRSFDDDDIEYRIPKIMTLLEAHYLDHEALLWLNSPHPQLEERKPIDLVTTGNAKSVLEVLERLDSGVYL